MKLLNLLKRINTTSFWTGTLLALKNPLFLYPTLLATKECMRIATLHYGKEHYKNTPANAFRHAFWNYLIAYNCAKWNSNSKKVLHWTKAITDWHENAFINRELPRVMDFHNNKIGRKTYVEHQGETFIKVQRYLQQMTLNSVKVSHPNELIFHVNSLVHICEKDINHK